MFDKLHTTIKEVVSKQRLIKNRLQDKILRSDVRTARILSVSIAGVAVLSMPVAAAPLDDIGQAMCGSGLGKLFGLVLAGIAIYLLAKAVVRAMMAFDKMGSSHDKTQFQGKQDLVGAGRTGVGAFVPVLAAGIFEVAGISTISCFRLDLGILYIGITNVPF